MVPDPAGIASRRSGGTAFVRNLPIHFLAMNTAPRARTAVRSADAKDEAEPTLPPAHDWRTTDDDERLRRKLRAQESPMRVRQAENCGHLFCRYEVGSGSGRTYAVELRELGERPVAACECVDFRINGLGTCKHVEAVLAWVQRCRKVAWREALRAGSPLVDLVPSADGTTLQVERNAERLPPTLARLFDDSGRLVGCSPEMLAGLLQRQPASRVRLALECGPWLEARSRAEERVALRREYEAKVQSGEWPAHETLVPLFPYQREGMLHLAFTGRALLADEMGLGKTVQAIAACALLHRLGRARRVLVVTPASLKTEWEEQIKRFTTLSLQIVYGGRLPRLAAYDAEAAPFFTLCNYEQIVADSLDLNERLRPDIVVLDEAQRIKNWSTKTAQAVKRLRSRYAFVLTGTPVENRIDELYSIVDFLDPQVFGPLFRFNREYYTFDEKGRPAGYRNLDALHERLRPIMLRRRKAEVETELPARTDEVRLVPLSPAQRETYADHEHTVSQLAAKAQRRPLLPAEFDRLMRELAMLRMVCDTNYILDDDERTCPKLAELEAILAQCCEEAGVKVIVFSEWERMLELVRELCGKLGIGHAWHTGSVPQQRRRVEINRFKQDPECRVFLSTDSGGVGLNLQNASVVVNCDLPWNPAKLEQRIARAWRKHQTRAVTVINLVSADTIEHRMLATLADKRGLTDGVLDRVGDLSQVRLRSGRQALVARLEQVMLSGFAPAQPAKPAVPADPAAAFAERAAREVGAQLVSCEERYSVSAAAAATVVAVVEREAELWRPRLEAAVAEPWKNVPGAAPRVVVLDRATEAVLAALADAGLVTVHIAATRRLHPTAEPARPALTEAQRQEVATQRALAARRLKAAQALLAAGLLEECVPPAQEAALAVARARAIERGVAAPADLRSCLNDDWRLYWTSEEAPALCPLASEAPVAVADTLAALAAALA